MTDDNRIHPFAGESVPDISVPDISAADVSVIKWRHILLPFVVLMLLLVGLIWFVEFREAPASVGIERSGGQQ